MKQPVVLTLVVGLLVVASGVKAQTPKVEPPEPTAAPSYTPASGFVPDAATAKRIAEAIWLPIYGKKVLNEKPYQATLSSKGVWVVEGSLPKGMDGGTAYIEISKQDGRILAATHGK
ncbi:hypothetical protein GCM10022409_21680 [Hymenobacter glaciei]|uniref:NTF2 fold domain-containing protein n=1 Tax=Hymenobacter glaciei TaxID=877209 RepID=A0ABP7U5S8_9BACT